MLGIRYIVQSIPDPRIRFLIKFEFNVGPLNISPIITGLICYCVIKSILPLVMSVTRFRFISNFKFTGDIFSDGVVPAHAVFKSESIRKNFRIAIILS